MIIKKYGLVLRRIKHEHIELVREKRNQDSVRNYMFYQKEISSKEQEVWFKSINNIYNYYFIIECDNKKVGLINGKNIDYENRTSEGGIFIWDENYRNIQVSAIASVIMAEFTFMIFDFKNTYAEILSSNIGQIKYNEFMGYKLDSQEGDKLIYILSKDNYLKKRDRLVKAVQQIKKDDTEISWNDLDFSKTTKRDIQNLYTSLPEHIQEKINKNIFNNS